MKRKMFSIDEVGRVQTVARMLDVNPSTLASAVSRQKVDTVMLGDDTPVVVIASVKAWIESERKRGPKPKRYTG